MLETRSLQYLIRNWTDFARGVFLFLLDQSAKFCDPLSLLQRCVGVPMPVAISNSHSTTKLAELTGTASRARIEAGCLSSTALVSHLSNENVLALGLKNADV